MADAGRFHASPTDIPADATIVVGSAARVVIVPTHGALLLQMFKVITRADFDAWCASGHKGELEDLPTTDVHYLMPISAVPEIASELYRVNAIGEAAGGAITQLLAQLRARNN